jgi:hypothetical protein
MILMVPCIIDFIGANGLCGPVGGRGPWTLLGLKWHRAKRVPFGPRRGGGGACVQSQANSLCLNLGSLHHKMKMPAVKITFCLYTGDIYAKTGTDSIYFFKIIYKMVLFVLHINISCRSDI